MRVDTTVQALLAASGPPAPGAVRAGTVDDAVDGIMPDVVVRPESAESLANVLGACSRQGLAVVLRGSGTKMAWGRPPARVDVLVSTERLQNIVEHSEGDLTVTIEAGASITGLNEHLARHGHWLPLDALSSRSTTGGAIATNDSGPLRHRYGAPRDLLIGIGLAMPDGRLVKAGGKVVKNVAGYDLGKCMSGSFGSLAAIVSATFKLLPVPPSSSTVSADFVDATVAARAAAALAESQLTPVALDVHASGGAADGARRFRVLTRFASSAASVKAQTGDAEHLVLPFAPERIARVAGHDEVHLWREQGERVWNGAGTVVKASWLPSALADVMSLLNDLRKIGARHIEIAGRAAAGTGLIRIEGDGPAAEVAVLDHFRRGNLLDNIVVLRAAPEVKAHVDVWGLPGDTAKLLRALKHAFDPAGIMNAGRGPI